MKLEEMLIDTEQQTEIKADIGDVFKGMLYRLGEGNATPEGTTLQMMLEPWAGGRWFRDRGNGISHLWGHVQAIKPPTLIELSGPMFMSYPAINHMEVRLEPIAGGTKVMLRHRALGLLEKAHREGVAHGWKHLLNLVHNDFAGGTATPRS